MYNIYEHICESYKEVVLPQQAYIFITLTVTLYVSIVLWKHEELNSEK